MEIRTINTIQTREWCLSSRWPEPDMTWPCWAEGTQGRKRQNASAKYKGGEERGGAEDISNAWLNLKFLIISSPMLWTPPTLPTLPTMAGRAPAVHSVQIAWGFSSDPGGERGSLERRHGNKSGWKKHTAYTFWQTYGTIADDESEEHVSEVGLTWLKSPSCWKCDRRGRADWERQKTCLKKTKHCPRCCCCCCFMGRPEHKVHSKGRSKNICLWTLGQKKMGNFNL